MSDNPDKFCPGHEMVDVPSSGRGAQQIGREPKDESGLEITIDPNAGGLYHLKTERWVEREDTKVRRLLAKLLIGLVATVICMGLLGCLVTTLTTKDPKIFAENLNSVEQWLFPSAAIMLAYYFGQTRVTAAPEKSKT